MIEIIAAILVGPICIVIAYFFGRKQGYIDGYIDCARVRDAIEEIE